MEIPHENSPMNFSLYIKIKKTRRFMLLQRPVIPRTPLGLQGGLKQKTVKLSQIRSATLQEKKKHLQNYSAATKN